MKRINLILPFIAFAVFVFAGNAMAYPTLDQVISGYPAIVESGQDYVYLSDLTDPETSIATLLLEAAAYESDLVFTT